MQKYEFKSISLDGTEYKIPDKTAIKNEFIVIKEQIEARRKAGVQIVVVQGLGFVGAAVAAVIADARDENGRPPYFVIGVDIPTADGYWKIAKINEGRTPIESSDEELPRIISRAVLKEKNLCATASEYIYSLADIIIVDIPLGVVDLAIESHLEIAVSLSGFKEAISSIGKHMQADALVLVETTVPIGTSEQIVMPILKEERLKRSINTPVYLAHAYERVMPGAKYVDSIRNFWRTFSGIDSSSALKAEKFLESFIDTDSYPLKQLDDTVSSEMAKVLENSYRAVNIAFIHEWTLLAEKIGVNLFSVIDSIRVRKGTHDNIRFPGFGVGGYCLTKDSLLAQWSANNIFNTDVVLKMTLDALQVNYQMPMHTFDLLKEIAGGDLESKVILVCGVSYLADVADTRNSPTELFINKLKKTGAKVIIHDSVLKIWPEQPDLEIQNKLEDCLSQVDGIVFAVPHSDYLKLEIEKILSNNKRPFIVDAQNIINDEKAEALYSAGCCIAGVGKGHWRKRGYQCKK